MNALTVCFPGWLLSSWQDLKNTLWGIPSPGSPNSQQPKGLVNSVVSVLETEPLAF